MSYICRKRRTTPVLAYLILEALSMIIMAILIIFILVGLQEAGSNAADEIAEGKYDLDNSDGSECFYLPTVEIAYILDVKLVDKYILFKSQNIILA